MLTKNDLSLAYSPGVAAPCLEIQKIPMNGNSVTIISYSTAVLGLGNIGAIASKPAMEEKACLLKRFADIDGVGIEVNCDDVEDFIKIVSAISTKDVIHSGRQDLNE